MKAITTHDGTISTARTAIAHAANQGAPLKTHERFLEVETVWSSSDCRLSLIENASVRYTCILSELCGADLHEDPEQFSSSCS